MQGKTKTTFINQSELEQRLNNQIKPTSFRLISGLEYTETTACYKHHSVPYHL
jgi:hypothetical protein